LRKFADEEEAMPLNHTKLSWVAYQIANKHPYSTMFERFATCEYSQSIIQLEMKAAFSLPNILSPGVAPPSIWGLSDYCPNNYEHGKFMMTLDDLLEEKWEVRRFHLWYIEAAKADLCTFIIMVPTEYFHTPMDGEILVDFHDMYRLLR